MPNDAALRMCSQVKAPNHHLALLKVFTDGEREEVLIDFPVQVELFDEKRGTLASGDWCQPNNTITGHPRQALLIGRRYESHIGHALVRLGRQANLVRRSVAPDVPTTIAHLTQLTRAIPLKCGRLFVLEVIRSRASLTLRCLYPEPGATCVENELMWLSLASKVDCGKYLYVEEV